MKHPVVHFEIPAADPERSAEFFRTVFGWGIVKVPVTPEMDYWLVTTTPTDENGRTTEPGINGGILKRNHPQQPCVNHVQVDDIDASCAAVEAAGGQIVVPKMPVPNVGYIAFFKDLDQHIHGLFQPDRSVR